MHPSKYSDKLIKIIESISCVKDEFAFHAMTSKIENPLRDIIAYKLHNLREDDVYVCKEWKSGTRDRSDIAVIDRNTQAPLCIIELKARTIPKIKDKELTDSIRKDIEKMKNKNGVNENTELFIIMIYTSLKLSQETMGHVKYSKYINNIFKQKRDYDELIKAAWLNVCNIHQFKDDEFKCFKIDVGNYYGTKVNLNLFLYRSTV